MLTHARERKVYGGQRRPNPKGRRFHGSTFLGTTTSQFTGKPNVFTPKVVN